MTEGGTRSDWENWSLDALSSGELSSFAEYVRSVATYSKGDAAVVARNMLATCRDLPALRKRLNEGEGHDRESLATLIAAARHAS